MKKLVLLMILLAACAFAHKPVIVGDDTRTWVPEPETSHAYYGELDGEPHKYIINATAPFTLYVNILVPDYSPQTQVEEQPEVNFIVDEYQGMDKIRTYGADTPTWDRYYEKHGKDHYLRGPELEYNVSSGVYIITVSSPTNQEKYTLAIGKEEDFSLMDYVTAWFKAKYLDWWFFS